MKQFLKKIIENITPQKIQDIFTYPLLLKLQEQTTCFAQEGEDLILETFFQNIKKGFFVDVGSFHPVKYSNTYLFYLKGWRGINIDARPQNMDIFNKMRPNDINLEMAIGKYETLLTYYMFDEPALNGFSKEVSEDRNKNTKYKIQKTKNKKLLIYP